MHLDRRMTTVKRDAATNEGTEGTAPLLIEDQGSFAVGGVVITHTGTYDSTKCVPDGQTLHGDHAYVTYQIPVGARKYPLAFVHGNLQFSRTWQTTPDG